jgi:uncharacterized protein (TIGR03000 family)
MLRRWIPGLLAVTIVLLTAESVFAQRLLDRIRARREARQDNTVQTVQPQTTQQSTVQPQQPMQQPAATSGTTTYYQTGRFGLRRRAVTVSSPTAAATTSQTQPATEVVYERRGLFGRRLVPVQTVARSTTTAQTPSQPATTQAQASPAQQPAPSTMSQGTTTYYERRGLFGRRRVPVQSTASINSNSTNNGTEPATRRSYYLEPGSSAVLLNVRVPANAEVLVDGQRTTQTGQSRQFVSPPLAPGFEYTYTVEARWQENGQPVTKTRRVSVRPGRETIVDFNQPDNQQ